ncbi:MAG: DUF4010 domain-containing protein, partial [Chloroflexota bacterium]|nr:DUF4010 domain-containing protein [Chloroflexota bacterium]
LITVLGTISAILAAQFGGWIVAAGLLAVVAVLVVTKWIQLKQGDSDHGTTTDMAILLMFTVGALLAIENMTIVAVAVGAGVAVLLQFKPELHGIVRRLGEADLKGIMQFVLITCIILPVLPNETFGPLNVLNPFETWLMVVLIVGMSLGGYITYKFFGQNAGILLGGFLGGAISSTATTVSSARQAQSGQTKPAVAAIVVLIASTVVFIRVLIEVAVVCGRDDPAFLRSVAPPIIILMLLTAVPSLILWLRVRREPAVMPKQENPTQLKSAVFFGAMYAFVLFALATTQQYAGDAGLYVVAALSGLTDMDAITLSTARLARDGDPMILDDGWRMIVIASLSNMVFKTGIVAMMADRRLLWKIAMLFSLPMAGGLLLLWLW